MKCSCRQGRTTAEQFQPKFSAARTGRALISSSALRGNRVEAVADHLRVVAEVVEPRQLRQALEPEDALEERRRPVANRTTEPFFATRLRDQPALHEPRD